MTDELDKIQEDFTGEDLKNMRLSSGKTMQIMADHVEVHRHTYGNYENGVSLIPLSYLLKWAKLCGMNCDSIFNYAAQCRKIVNEQQLIRPRKKRTDDTETEEKLAPEKNKGTDDEEFES